MGKTATVDLNPFIADAEDDDAALIASLDVRAGEDSDGIEIAIGQTVALPGRNNFV